MPAVPPALGWAARLYAAARAAGRCALRAVAVAAILGGVPYALACLYLR